MLEKLRKPGKTFFNSLIFGFICLIFVFIGVPLQQMSSGGFAIKVNGEALSWAEYQNYLNILQEQDKSGEGDPNLLQKRVIDTLLTGELVRQEQARIKMVVSEQELKETILNLPFLQEEGRWTQTRYRTFLKNRGLTPAYFEKRMGEDLLSQRFQGLFDQTALLSQAEKAKQKELRAFKVKLAYLSFATSDLSLDEQNNLIEWVKAKDLSLLNHFIEQKQAKWQDLSFDLSQSRLPELGEHPALMEAIFDFLPQNGPLKKVILSKDRSFIVRVKNWTKGPLKKEESLADGQFSPDFFAQLMAGRLAFMSWLQAQKEQSEVKLNPRLNPPASPGS